MTTTKVSIAPISTLAAEVSNHLTRKHVCNLLPAAATLGREPPAVPYRGLWHLCRGKARLATFCADRSAAISAARQASTTKDSSLGAVWGIAAALGQVGHVLRAQATSLLRAQATSVLRVQATGHTDRLTPTMPAHSPPPPSSSTLNCRISSSESDGIDRVGLRCCCLPTYRVR